MKLLVTGATGFIGRRLCMELISQGHQVSGLVRHRQNIPANLLDSMTWYPISGLDDEQPLAVACNGIEVVIHLAAHVHRMGDTDEQESVYTQVNCQGSLNLARAASTAGVGRFIFLSSIKVNGEERQTAYCASDEPKPQDVYARSKYAAEQGLQLLAQEKSLSLVIIRPPLVYGEGVKANFLQLTGWVKRGIPMPLAGIYNQRSMVSVVNLVDLIRVCINHPDADGQVLLVSDGETVSTSQLVERIARSYSVNARLFKCPAGLLHLFARLTGRADSLERLLGSLTVDINPTCERLSWTPPVTMQQTLLAMATKELSKNDRSGRNDMNKDNRC